MNIDHVNNPIDPKRQAGRTNQQQQIRPEPSAPVEGTSAADQATPVAPAPDSVDIDTRSRLVEELTDTVARMDDSPREDLVERIRSQIRNGTYNSSDTIRRVAQSMLSRDILTD